MRTTRHATERIVQRIEDTEYRAEARKLAKIAYRSGATINKYQKCPRFYSYLHKKYKQSNEITIRVYRDYIYIWKGRSRSLVTVYAIPDRFKEEIECQ